MPDAELDGAAPASTSSTPLLADPARLDAMARRVHGGRPRPDAAERVADLVERRTAAVADRPSIDLVRRRWPIHVVGIGGAGMSAIATVLAAMGHRVSRAAT